MTEASISKLSQDELFELLSSARRRFILFYLQQNPMPIELQTLAEELAAWENETAVDDLTPQQRKRVYVSLYQTHIPKLEELGIISYDSDSGYITLENSPEQIMSILGERERELPWQLFYLLLSGIAIALYLAIAIELPIVNAVTPLQLSVGVIVSFVLLSLVHFYYVRVHQPVRIDIDELA